MSSSDRSSATGIPRRNHRRFPLIASGVVLAGVLVALLAFANRPSNAPHAAAASAGYKGGRSLGRSDASVRLDVWADFQCPACRFFALNVEPQIIKTYVDTGQANLTFHDMAYLGKESVEAAISARCADRQAKFWPYQRLLYENQAAKRDSGAFSWDHLTEFATGVNLDVQAFLACVDDPSVVSAVSMETGKAYADHVKETPTLMVNGVTVSNAVSWPAVSAAIDAAMKRSSDPSTR